MVYVLSINGKPLMPTNRCNSSPTYRGVGLLALFDKIIKENEYYIISFHYIINNEYYIISFHKNKRDIIDKVFNYVTNI